MIEENLGELILNHYETYLGEFVDRKVYQMSGGAPAIQLLEYKNVFENCTTYATIGLTKYFSRIDNLCEVVLVVDDDYEKSAKILANSLFFMIQNRISFGTGTAIAGVGVIDKEYEKKNGKQAVYYTETHLFPEEFSVIRDGNGNKKVNLYMAFMISQAEYKCFEEKGAEALEDLLELKEADVFDIDRESVV